MIKSYQTNRKESFNRLKAKSEESFFTSFIFKNTNLSRIETQVVFEEFSKKYLCDNNRSRLRPLQTLFLAAKIDAKHGQELSETDFKEIVITLHNDEDDKIRGNPSRFCKEYNFPEVDSTTAARRNKILRITREAYTQGAVLTEEDLSYRVFNCGLRTIQRDIKAFKDSGITIPLRGFVCDIGRSITHKVDAIKELLSGKELSAIARGINHSPEAVEKYVTKFLQIGSAIEQGLKDSEISYLTSTSYSLLKEYREIYEKAKDEDKLDIIKENISINPSNISKKKAGGVE